MSSEDEHSVLEELVDDVAEELEEIEERSPLARTLITVAATVVLVALLAGVLLAVSMLMRGTETARSSIDSADVPQVAIRAGDADVRVIEGDNQSIDVEADVTSGLTSTSYELRRRGAEIEVVTGCFALLNPGCGVDLVVTVPQGLPVEISTSGDIEADGLTDRVLTLASTEGDVRATDLEVDELSATTRGGDVTATFAADPYAVKVTTTSGDVDVTIPGRERDYRVDVASETGEAETAVESVEDADSFIRMRSTSGDVAVAQG